MTQGDAELKGDTAGGAQTRIDAATRTDARIRTHFLLTPRGGSAGAPAATTYHNEPASYTHYGVPQSSDSDIALLTGARHYSGASG